MLNQISFTLPQILSLLGFIQCVYLLVYMSSRTRDWQRAALPFLYFAVLGLAFLLDFIQSYMGSHFLYYELAPWMAWFMLPPLSVLLIIQISQVSRSPSLSYFWLPALIPLAGLGAFIFAQLDHSCILPIDCPVFKDWLVIFGLAAGLISVLTLWSKSDLLRGLAVNNVNKERYWLVLTLIFTNLIFLGLMLFSLFPAIEEDQLVVIRTLLGLGFIYLVSSSLFRIYPQAMQLVERRKREIVSDQEMALVQRIQDLLTLDKIYQEPAYNRGDLARELDTPEATVSRIINTHFGKSFPQLLNEKRVRDAQRLLLETDLPVKEIADQVGFNALASFNRVFREMTETTPSAFRDKAKR